MMGRRRGGGGDVQKKSVAGCTSKALKAFFQLSVSRHRYNRG